MNYCRILLILCALVIPCFAHSQSLYSYQQLSKSYYAKQKDSLKKTWVCPDIYKNKSTQKEYTDIWNSRTEFLTDAIDNQNFVYEPSTYNYIESIIEQIANANSKYFAAKPLLLLDRSSAVNAYALGGNIIVVNLGLIDYAQSREELALAISHELSHNILNHVENVMKERAEWLTSDEYKQSLNAVLDSKYERFSKLKKVLENYSFDRSRHQRYHESDADSLAIILLKNCNIAFKADFFLRLDSADLEYKQPLKQPLKDYFVAYNLPFEDSWTQQRAKGLSTRNYSFKDTTSISDSLKTHPDCPERYKKTLPFSDAHALLTPIPESIKDKVAKMIIWNIYDNMNLTACLYRVFEEKDKGKTDQWFDFMIYNIFNGLCYNDRELHRFIAIGVTPKEYISKDYYALQNMLEQMPRESISQYCTLLQNGNFWTTRTADEKALKNLMYTLALDSDDSDKTRWNAANDFETNNGTSLYCEFADHFKKK